MVDRRDRRAYGGCRAGHGLAPAKHARYAGCFTDVVGPGLLGGAVGIRRSVAARRGRAVPGTPGRQSTTPRFSAAAVVGEVLRRARLTRAANRLPFRETRGSARPEPPSA